MLKLSLCLCLLLAATYAADVTYTLAETTASTAATIKKVELTTGAATAAWDAQKWTFKYTAGANTPVIAANEEDGTICCTTAAKDTTDSHANALVNRCFAAQLACSTADQCKNADKTSLKLQLNSGTKSGTAFKKGIILSGPTVVNAVSDGTGSLITAEAIELSPGVLAATGFVSTTASDLTVNCYYTQLAGTGPDLTAAELTLSGTPKEVTVTKTGSSVCAAKASTSGALTQALLSLSLISVVIAAFSLE